ncbi:MAG: LptF/LptG family permease [Prevotellaceae bacterium]|nr:LptF/LptG family permease [Prevotellaceae bacterium]
MIKKIDLYLLKNFITLLVMTFLICAFILLMQFMWMRLNDLVGKGISILVLAEFFFYAFLSVVPLALPLAILLASLMTFGNLGEKFELTAMKASGISLFRIMRPLIFLLAFISISAFYFSNNIYPKANSKLWTLVFSLRHKSPELEIPAGEFYSGIGGYNLYVREKEKNLLKGMMIYDFSSGFNNAVVMVADSGYIKFTEDKKYLMLSLFSGESFENLKQQQGRSNNSGIPYRRETFQTKEILIDFDSNFNRYDESILQNQSVSKNVSQLSYTIDSIGKIVDVRGAEQAYEMIRRNYFGRETSPERILKQNSEIDKKQYNPDSLFLNMNQQQMVETAAQAKNMATQKQESIRYNKISLQEATTQLTRHATEFHRRFTLSFACLIFFFIGAPLGAIIRKGGLGMPVVVSVLMFIVYYIIDTAGYKMAREGLWEPFEGMWLSSSVLLPVGIFLTYKAAVDSELFRNEAYLKFFKKIYSLRKSHLYIRVMNKLTKKFN